MLWILVQISVLYFHSSSSLERTRQAKSAGRNNELAYITDSGIPRERRQAIFSPVIPEEVKEEFKQYATNYLNSVVTAKAKKPKEEKKTPGKRARICAEVCQHRCLPSCEWACCIKDNIEEYRSAHLVKPLVVDSGAQRKSHLATAKESAQKKVGEKRAHVVEIYSNHEETLKDGHECNPSCKRYCVPKCRFACCQPVQIKGVLLF